MVRYGYACVNQTLTNRPKKLGGRVTTSRTARKASWYPNNLQLISDKALDNAKDLLTYLKWNEEHGITLFRVGSELFPWHDQYELHDLPDYEEIAQHLFAAGEFARQHGHRLTTHPGPFHVLGSPRQDVVEKSIIGLERHSEMFDLMGYEPSFHNKINIHVAGAYGDREATAKRWIKTWQRLSDSLKARLVLENDDKSSMYSVRHLYDLIHQEIGIPITFDYWHHTFCTGDLTERQAFFMAKSTWDKHGVTQCTHYSESRRQEQKLLIEKMLDHHNISIDNISEWPTFEKQYKIFSKIKEPAHADYIVNTPNTYNVDNLDIVVEAKAKELAILPVLEKQKKLLII
jgi:UV DNA damage endonuclease